jgi:type IV pilus assembly protein PilZ
MSDAAKVGGARAGMLSLAIKERAALYMAYMPFIKNGGLFIPSTRSYQLGDQVYMLISLMEDPAKIPVSGRVAWVTPSGCQGNRQQGVGVQFDDNESANLLRQKIEGILGNAMKSSKPTHTL